MIMSSLTMPHDGELAALQAHRKPSTQGRLSAFFRRMATARENVARRRVAEYLGACSDARLRDLGLGARDIEAVRAGTFNGVRG
jgi:uncharacterized protein YjiS (DUF1127 family)